MMEEYDVEEPQVATVNGVADGKKRDFVDQVCDPCGLIPENLDEAFAHKQKMKLVKEATQASENAENAIPQENDDAADEAVANVLSTFDCCGKTPAPTTEDIENRDFPMPVEEPEEEVIKVEENTSVGSTGTRSLADIAARMDDIDLETAGEDVADEQLSNSNKVMKFDTERAWYKEPLYAGLIFMSVSFCIAIIVMAILIAVRR